MKPLSILTLALPLLAQPQATKWAHVDDVSIASDKGALYRGAEKEKIKPFHQERVSAGKEYAWASYTPRWPHGGTGDGVRGVRMMITDSFEAAGGAITPRGFPAGLFRIRSGELWALRDSVNLNQLLASPWVRVVNHKLKAGLPNTNDYLKLYLEGFKPQIEEGVKNGRYTGWAVFTVMYPSGSNATHEMVVMYGLASFAKAGEGAPGPTTPERRAVLTKLSDLAAIAAELWALNDRTTRP